MKRFQIVAGIAALAALGAFTACESLPVAPIVEEGDYPDASADAPVDALADAPRDTGPGATVPADATTDVAIVTDASASDADAGPLDAATDASDADAGD